MPLDLTGLTPLDTTGLRPAEGFDLGGLRPLDVSGLREAEPERTALAEAPVRPLVGRERYSRPLPGAPTSEPDVPPTDFAPVMGRGESAAGSFAQGAADVIAGVPKSISMADAALVQSTIAGFDYIDQHGEPEYPGDRLAPTPINRYWKASPEERLRMRGEAAWAADPRQGALYQAGEAIEGAVREVAPSDPAYRGEFLAEALPQGAGSTLGFLTGGLLARTLRLPPTTTTAGLGMSVQAASQFEDALASGATIETALEAAKLSLPAGASEALPISRMLDRLDKGSGGKIKRAIVEAIKGGTEEALQEVGQTIMSNAIAQGLYDPERGWFDGAEQGGAVGFTTGGLFNFLVSVVGGRRGAGAAQPAPPPKPAGEIQKAEAAPPLVTPEDVASPLPTDLIAEGRRVMAGAEGAKRADDILSRNGMPATGSPVTVTWPDGRTQTGTVADAFREENAELGITAEGVKIALDGGGTLEEFFPTLRQAGVEIAAAPLAEEGEAIDVSRETSPLAPVLAEPLPAAAAPLAEVAATVEPVAPSAPPVAEAAPVAAAPLDTAGLTPVTQEAPRDTQGRLEVRRPLGEGQEAVEAAEQGRGEEAAGPGGILQAEGQRAAGGIAAAPEGDGTRASPLRPVTAADITAATQATAATSPDNDRPEPTEPQQGAGNYAKTHIKDLFGLDVAIENPKGSTRSGTAPDGTTWSVEMPAHYGYIKRTEGADGDQVDVYIGDDLQSRQVFVVDQIDPKTGEFDEHKALLGFTSQEAAIAAYDRGFSDGSGPTRRGAVTPMSVEGFRTLVREGDTSKPVTYRPEPAAQRALKEKIAGKRAAAAAPALPAEDVPAWAEVHGALPKDPQGRADVEYAARLMYEISGKRQPSFRDLTPEQKVEMLRRLKTEAGPAGDDRPEHPGLVIKSLETGKVTEIQPAGTRPPAVKPEQPASKLDRREIGKNADGETIFEDGRGVRSVVTAEGIRVTEKVALDPRGGISVDRTDAMDARYRPVEPEAAPKVNEPAPAAPAPATAAPGPAILPAEEDSDGVQAPLPAGDARPGAEDVQRAPAERPARGAPAGEGDRGAADVRGTDLGRAEAPERLPEGAVGEGGRESGSRDADRVPERDGGRERADAGVKGDNFLIEPGALHEGRGWKQKARDNIRAIELMRAIEAEGRPATRAEQEQLALYVGWGGIKGAFPDTEGNFAKGFEETGQKLKELLTDTEYATARRSIQYAHYTSETIVRAMWEAARRLGYVAGKVFEPGMGVGNFAGMMPPDLAAATSYHGLELDHTTARIARLLYPEWGVRRDDFTKAPLPKDTYDLVIGNPPFADVAIKSDPEYAKHGFLLHDYFFAKSLDGVRPGGLLMFISSAGTMNKIDQKAREYLADRADLVGAIRLPGDAFEKNAGTAVTTDIVILRKRLPDEAAGDRSWVETVEVTLPDKTGKPTKGRVNRWFADHPENVLGEEGFFDKLYAGRYGVRSIEGDRLAARIAEAIERLPTGVMSDWQDASSRTEVDFGTAEHKEGAFYLADSGRLMQVRGGVGVSVQTRGKGVEGGMSFAGVERVKMLVPVRDALRAVYDADLKDDTANAAKARERLNAAYDSFVARFGPINKAEFQYRRPNAVQQESARSEAREEARFAGLPFDEGSFDPTDMIRAGKSLSEISRARKALKEQYESDGTPWSEGTFDPEEMPDNVIDRRPNIDPFMDDPESYRLRAIEKYNDATGEAKKSRVFFENVITREKAPEIKSVGDALLFVLNKRGRLDLPEIAQAAGVSESEAIESLGEAIFRIPGTENAWETRDAMLSGNVRKKLRIARAAAEQDPAFERNVKALETAQPAPIPPSEISANLGMPWLPTDVIEEFGAGIGLEDLKVKYLPALAQWFVEGDRQSAAATSTWGTSDRPAPVLLSDALNRQDPKVYETVWEDGKKKQVLNVEATQAAQDKVREIKARFEEWVWSDAERASRLAGLYNEEYNSLVVREFDGSYLTTPGISAEWEWRAHQTRVIARVIQAGNTYLAHAVGAGKTSEMIAAIMEMRRLGLIRKGMVSVPNHMLGQFTKEWYEQYPTAKIAVADERRFHTDRRKQFIADVANEDLDAVVITHSAFGLIPVSTEFQDGLIQEQIDQYRSLLEEVGEGEDNRITRRRLENAVEKLEQRLSGRAQARKDQVYTFEEMGIDFLAVDEAHLFRKLDFASKMTNIKGISPEGSKAAFDLYVKSRYLETINPGRNLVLASGTPVTNTMAELYTVSRYLQPRELAERGLSHFDAWAGAFGDTVTQLEQNAAGGYQPVTRFAKFVNVPELSAMVRQVMDVVTSRQLEQYVTRPKLKDGKRQMHLAEKGEALQDYQNELSRRMEAIARRKGPPKPGDDIILAVINDGRHAAIDMRLVDPKLPNDPGSKLNLLVDEVFRIWKETKRQAFHRPEASGFSAKPFDKGPAAQMVFSNLGLGDARDFNVHKYIVGELARRGVPKTEIALIADFKTHVAKQRLFNDMNEGKVRVLIGSTSKMATGVNAQRRLYAVHNLDPLWYPADDEQRNGRIIRQGNTNPEIEIHDYSTKGTYDSTMWGLMETKARFIQGFFEGDPSLRDMEDLGEASQYEQAKAMTTNDPRLIELTGYRQDLERARRRRAAFEREQYAVETRVAEAKRSLLYADKRIRDIGADIARRQDTSGDAFKAKAGKKSYADRVEFGDALLGQIEALTAAEVERKDVVLGAIGGFEIAADIRSYKSDGKRYWAADVVLRREGGFESEIKVSGSARGLVQSLEATLGGFEADLARAQGRKAEAEKTIADFTPQLGKRFGGQAEIDDLVGKVHDLESQLRAETKALQQAAEARAPAEEQTPDEKLSLRTGETRPNLVGDPAALEADLRARLEQIGIADKVALEVVEAIRSAVTGQLTPAEGRYSNGLIEVALSAGDKPFVLNHESVHALRDFGLFRDAEWRTLERAALADAERMAEIRERYAAQGLAEEALVEEAVADMFADWSAGRSEVRGFIRTAFERIRAFLEALGNALRGAGFQTAGDVFERIESGEVGAREAIDEPGPMGLSERFMVAWHGGPHDFDEFDIGRIGTGEGAQAFGWGLYFAGRREIAEHYRDRLSSKDRVRPDEQAGRDHGAAWDRLNERIEALYREMIALQGDAYQAADRQMERLLDERENLHAQMVDETIARRGGKAGRLYTVDLAPAEDEYLLWDRAWPEQSASVKTGLMKLWTDKGGSPDRIAPWTAHSGADGQAIYAAVATSYGSEEAASKSLRAAGIPGIKYLDGGSRSTGDGTYNYVIFDDSLVTITEKYSLPKRPARPAGAADSATFDQAESERRWQDARKGAAAQETLVARTSAWLETIANGFTRHYIALPNTARFSDVREQIRKLEAAPQASKEQVVRILKSITEGMTPADLDLFTRKVVLDDLSWEADQEREIPFGMSAEDVAREKAKVDAIMDRRPDLAAAVRQRKLIVRQAANELVDAGVLHKEQVRNPAYYRHQVLDYARAQVAYAKGTGRKLKSPHWARRMGSTLDINANLLEAEFDWLHKAFTDVATARTIDWIKRSEHNVRQDVIDQAKAHNARLVQAALDREGDGGPLHDQWKGFRQKIAMGLSKVRKAIEDGALYVPDQFEGAADRLTGDADNDASIFPFLAWILDNDEAGAMGAAQAFKAIGQRKAWVKDLLGDRYADPMDVGGLVKRFAPDGYVAWQPDEGKLLFTAKTLPERVIDRMMGQIAADGIGPIPAEELRGAMESVRSMLAVGGNKFELVIPEELAATLNSLRDPHADDLINFALEAPMRWWKRWVLINPRRVIKYNLNNLSGDLDAVIAGNPKALRHMGQAIKELYAVMLRGKAPSARYREAVERGVFDSGLSIQEIPDINVLSEFESLMEKPPVYRADRFALSGLMKVWRALQRYTQFRENWLRYAAYLDYAERIEGGEPMSSIGYGAAVPEMVDAIADPKDRAALLARELVGDYGAVSHWGQKIRRKAIPFWSWMEINAKRYWRLTSNAYGQGVGKGLQTAGLLGAGLGLRTTAYLTLRMALMYGLIQVWNNLVFGDDEDDLDPEERARMHLLLGRGDDGEIRMLRIQGAFGDALSWFGFEDVVDAVSEVEKGRAGVAEILEAIVKAPVNKIVGGITPVLKVPLEALSGLSLWPDAFRPMPIKDAWRNLFRTFSLEHEYDLVFDKPSRGYGRSLSDAVIYERDAGENAYNRLKGMSYDWLRREKGQEGSSSFTTPRSTALYEWRLAKRYGDDEAADQARERLRELGVTGDDLRASIKRAHPLGAVAIKDRAAFLRTLSTDEREQLDQAIDWYRDTFLD